MRRTIATLAAGCLLALVPVSGWADEPASSDLVQILVETASTPAQHQALARYYRAKATEAKQLAGVHQSMSKSYSAKPGQLKAMREHCDKLVKLNQDLAAQYDALAKAEEAAAK